ncbi:MAG TPA: tRNA pseudouridine(38-40) synthase TruA [Clostridia bacterium]|nr:tRNA pseudouridine(38-40) synthase TruA [Clostridia bacterium]
MRNILVFITFNGARYHGWQVQKNAVTVQQTVQDALEKILKTRPGIVGCSRTDAGVHAYEYAFQFRTQSTIPCISLVKALNVTLPHDIAAFRCREVNEDFHARYSVVYKEYIYQIYNSKTRNPFFEGRALFVPRELDCAAMADAAARFLGRHDFTSFCAAGGSVLDKVRNIMLFDVAREGSLVTIRIRADGFLYNMVRILAGTLLDVSDGKIGAGDIKAILASGDRNKAGPTLPAHGLYLNQVCYGE